MKKISNYYFVYLFFFPVLLGSCMDKEYDLNKDIDITIHVGGSDLSLPVGSTDSVRLDKIIKMDDSDLLHLSAGEYSLLKNVVIDPVFVKIESFTPVKVAPIQFPIINTIVPSGNHIGSFKIDIPLTSGLLNLNHNSLPLQVHSVKRLTFDALKPVKAILKIVFKGIPSNTNIEFSDLKLAFPNFVVSKELDAKGELILNGPAVAVFTKEIYLDAYDFSYSTDGALKVENQAIFLSDEVTLCGGINLTNLDFSLLDENISMSSSIEISPASISEVEGSIDPMVKVEIDPISLDLPDFLKDNSVTLDVLNPMVRLNVTNQTNVPLILNGVLTGFRDGKPLSSVEVRGGVANPILVQANGQTSICVSRTGSGGPLGSENYKVSNLNDLIAKIPDQIQFSMNLVAKEGIHKILLGKEYGLNMDCAVEIPFRFGPGLSIVYNDTIDNFNKDLQDIEVKQLKMTTNVENNIPLALKLDAIAVGLDKNDGALSDIFVKVTGDIQPCDKDGNVQTSPLTIELTEKVSGALEKLDGLLLKVTAKSTETVNGMALKDSQFIRLKDIKVKASGGVTVDLNNI